MLSRNFRLQKVGDTNWLKKNYNFSLISFFIDELIILDVTRENRDKDNFSKQIKTICDGCFVPISLGGGIRSVDDARKLLNSGADKIVLNSAIFSNLDLIKELYENFGQQCLVASVDFKKNNYKNYDIVTNMGQKNVNGSFTDLLGNLNSHYIGECYLNSIDQDGTGQGYDMNILDFLPNNWNIPIILAGGAGNSSHMIDALNDGRVNAVATAHLFNFIGDGLKLARESIKKNGIELANWPSIESFRQLNLDK